MEGVSEELENVGGTACVPSDYSMVEAWRAALRRSRLPAVSQHHFPAPRDRAPSRGSASNGPSGGGNDGGSLEGCAPSQPPAGRKSTSFPGAEGPGALQGIGQQWSNWWQQRWWKPGGLRSVAAAC